MKLYHAGMSTDDTSAMIAAGWEPIDVRLLSNKSPNDKVIAVSAWLEGVRLGSIIPDKGTQRFVELEMRSLGMLEAKKGLPPPKPQEKQTTKDLLDIGSNVHTSRVV